MKQRHFFVLISVIALTGVVWFFVARPKVEKSVPFHHPYDFQGVCPGESKPGKMNDVYLRGTLDLDAPYHLVENWYWCKPVERGDLVLLKWAEGRTPVVRQVYGIPGDKFKVTLDPKQKLWGLQINGEKIQTNNVPFLFGVADVPPPLKLLEQSRGGVLSEREIIVLSAFPPGDTDSSILGVVNLNDVLGKVVPDNRH